MARRLGHALLFILYAVVSVIIAGATEISDNAAHSKKTEEGKPMMERNTWLEEITGLGSDKPVKKLPFSVMGQLWVVIGQDYDVSW